MKKEDNSHMKKSHFTIIISVVTASLLHANDSDQDMESLLNNVSTIATKKSINVDYMPSVVTVIDAETFLDAGLKRWICFRDFKNKSARWDTPSQQ